MFNNVAINNLGGMSPGAVGGSVTIPGAFIQQSDGQTLLDLLNIGRVVTMTMGNIS